MESHWKQLGSVQKLGGAGPQGITRVGQTVSLVDGVSDVTSSSWLGLLGEGSKKKQWLLTAVLSRRKLFPSSCLDARHFSSSPYASGAFQAAALVLKLRRSESE